MPRAALGVSVLVGVLAACGGGGVAATSATRGASRLTVTAHQVRHPATSLAAVSPGAVATPSGAAPNAAPNAAAPGASAPHPAASPDLPAVPANPASAPAPPALAVPNPPATDSGGYAATLVQLVNNERAKAGLRPLAFSSCASGYAQSWAQHLAASGQFAHQSVTAVMAACGARGAGENIGRTGGSPAQLVAMWMASPRHRANILNPAFTAIGSGASSAGGVWTACQDFLAL